MKTDDRKPWHPAVLEFILQDRAALAEENAQLKVRIVELESALARHAFGTLIDRASVVTK